ncbi:MAG: anaerobic ribonucleoside-triphosphate reductase [Candidatus Woesearchaeota archaeon]
MKCAVCAKPLAPKEGLVSNVNLEGKEPAEGEQPVVVCSDSCRSGFEKSLKMKGKPIVHMSRITGYMQIVENWNKGKQQEFFDRKRYSLAELKE